MTQPTNPPANSPGTPKSRKKKKRDLARIAGVALFFVGAAYALKHPWVQKHLLDINQLRADLKAMGWYSTLAYIAGAGIINSLGLPRLWVSAITGSLFGAVAGIIIAQVSTLLGATLNFFTGRYLLRGPITRRMPDRMRLWYDRFNRHGFKAILYIRLFPFANATLTNLLGGVSRVSYPTFLAATFVGYLPFTIALAILGSSAAKSNHFQLALGLGIFALVALLQFAWSRRSRRLQSGAPGEENLLEDTDSEEAIPGEIR